MEEYDGTLTDNRTDGSPFRQAKQPAAWRLLGAASAGFLCGIAFWHLVGFWSMVNEAVFHPNPSASAPSPARLVAAKSQGRQSGGPAPPLADNEACSDAAPDPDGFVRVSICPAGVRKFAPPRAIDRADFADFGSTPETKLINGDLAPSPGAPSVSGWSAEVAPSSKP